MLQLIIFEVSTIFRSVRRVVRLGEQNDTCGKILRVLYFTHGLYYKVSHNRFRKVLVQLIHLQLSLNSQNPLTVSSLRQLLIINDHSLLYVTCKTLQLMYTGLQSEYISINVRRELIQHQSPAYRALLKCIYEYREVINCIKACVGPSYLLLQLMAAHLC